MAYGDRAITFTVDNIGNPEPIIVQSYDTTQVVVHENNIGAATTDFIIHQPFMTSPGITYPAGTSFTFTRHSGTWGPGTTVGYIETVTSSSATFAQEEK